MRATWGPFHAKYTFTRTERMYVRRDESEISATSMMMICMMMLYAVIKIAPNIHDDLGGDTQQDIGA